MIVAPAGVPGDGARGFGVLALLARRPLVAPREADDAPGPGKDRIPVETLARVPVARQPPHFTVHPGADEGLIALDVSIETHVGPGDSDGVETELPRLGAHPDAEPPRSGVVIGK